MRLIDADALIAEGWVLERHGVSGKLLTVKSIADVPTIDAVPVVRCKDCKYAYINSFSAASGVAVCKKWSNEAETAIMQQDNFCSYGERREENAAD